MDVAVNVSTGLQGFSVLEGVYSARGGSVGLDFASWKISLLQGRLSRFRKQHLSGLPQTVYSITKSKIIFCQANYRTMTNRQLNIVLKRNIWNQKSSAHKMPCSPPPPVAFTIGNFQPNQARSYNWVANKENSPRMADPTFV